jgi:hypothetical protein
LFVIFEHGNFPKYATKTKIWVFFLLLGWYMICEVLNTTILEVAAVLFYYKGDQINDFRERQFSGQLR